MFQCPAIRSSHHTVDFKTEPESADIPKQTQECINSSPSATTKIKTKLTLTDTDEVVMKTEPTESCESQLSQVASYNIHDMKFEIDENDPICSGINTETAIKENEDKKAVDSGQTRVADKKKQAKGKTTKKTKAGKRTAHAHLSYQCKVCLKLLKSPSQLLIHHKTHTGEKPFKCEVCQRAFNETGSVVSSVCCGEMSLKRKLVPALEVEKSSGGSLRERERLVLEHTPKGGNLGVWKPNATPEATPGSSAGRPKKARRSLQLLKYQEIVAHLMDSGSDDGGESEEEEEKPVDIIAERAYSRKLRREAILYEEERICEGMSEGMNEEERATTAVEGEGMADARSVPRSPGSAIPSTSTANLHASAPAAAGAEECEGLIVIGTQDDDAIDQVLSEVVGIEEGLEQPTLAKQYEGLDVFTWSEDFSTFFGQAETYLRTPGPNVGTQDPVEIFMTIWDQRIMKVIVDETNRYAWQHIAPLSEHDIIPEYLRGWDDTTVEEMYRYFAILILMSLCYRSRLTDYWTTGILEMPKFRNLMSRNRFQLISRFLHFANNEDMALNLSSYNKKIYKVRPILDHCNEKFSSLYIPNKHLSLDESLLLWKGRLSWVQSIRTKAARFGIKSYELCEATTGYQLRCLLYAGKESKMSEEPIHGFESCTTKVVLELMNGFLDVGHTLVMDNWYNQLPMTRLLKRRKTDVIGTMKPRRVHVPDDIKNAKESQLARGDQIARHCGDISLVAWKDVKLVTSVSTFHTDKQVPARRAGENIKKPEAIEEYNKYMGGVDSKDQKLSMFLMERKRSKKWYMKVFKKQLNTSLLNAFIIYTKHQRLKTLSHREFRHEVAIGLLSKFCVQSADTTKQTHSASSTSVEDKHSRRLMKGVDHFVDYTDSKEPGAKQRKQMRCVRCTAAGRRKMVSTICTFCGVPLCGGSCWAEYHTLENLK